MITIFNGKFVQELKCEAHLAKSETGLYQVVLGISLPLYAVYHSHFQLTLNLSNLLNGIIGTLHYHVY